MTHTVQLLPNEVSGPIAEETSPPLRLASAAAMDWVGRGKASGAAGLLKSLQTYTRSFAKWLAAGQIGTHKM